MEIKKNHIAVLLDEKGECVSIAKCVIVDDTNLAKLRNQVLKHKQAEQKKKEELMKKLSDLTERCDELEKQIKLLKGEDYEESN